MIKNVLVPIDLGHIERTDSMLDVIRNILAKDEASITLLHVIAELPGYIAAQIPPDIQKNAVQDANDSLKNLVSEHQLPANTVIKVEYGHPFQTILRVAHEDNADLIVIGSHKPGPSDYLLGSVAGKVVRHARCSVIVVR